VQLELAAACGVAQARRQRSSALRVAKSSGVVEHRDSTLGGGQVALGGADSVAGGFGVGCST
jgi:hypothetical protein